jgi:hypothetical protein
MFYSMYFELHHIVVRSKFQFLKRSYAHLFVRLTIYASFDVCMYVCMYIPRSTIKQDTWEAFLQGFPGVPMKLGNAL